jgi:hypothetical protein
MAGNVNEWPVLSMDWGCGNRVESGKVEVMKSPMTNDQGANLLLRVPCSADGTGVCRCMVIRNDERKFELVRVDST